jgi:hypothetical protein
MLTVGRISNVILASGQVRWVTAIIIHLAFRYTQQPVPNLLNGEFLAKSARKPVTAMILHGCSRRAGAIVFSSTLHAIVFTNALHLDLGKILYL